MSINNTLITPISEKLSKISLHFQEIYGALDARLTHTSQDILSRTVISFRNLSTTVLGDIEQLRTALESVNSTHSSQLLAFQAQLAQDLQVEKDQFQSDIEAKLAEKISTGLGKVEKELLPGTISQMIKHTENSLNETRTR